MTNENQENNDIVDANPTVLQEQPEQRSLLTQTWSGPLPPPAALEHFDRIVPGAAERILAMVEKEQAHRIDHEKSALSAAISDSKTGKAYGFFLALLAIGGAIFTAYIGCHPLVPTSLVGLPVAAMIYRLISGKNKHE